MCLRQSGGKRQVRSAAPQVPPPPDTSYPPLEASEQPQDRPAGRGHLRTEALKGRSLR